MNTDLTSKKSKKQAKVLFEESPIEAIRDIGRKTKKMAKDDLVVGTARSVTEQLFGGVLKADKAKGKTISGDIVPGEALEVGKLEEVKKLKKREFGKERAREFAKGEEGFSYYEKEDTKRQIKEILETLKRLVKESEELKQEFKEAVMETPPQEAGKYHLSFFSFLLRMVSIARKKINESATWLSLFRSRKKERNYWAMFKKKGTSFGLSGERVVATSTG